MTIRMLPSNCLRIAIIKEMMIIIFVFRNAVQSLLYAILLREGIDPERLTPKGYGEQQPKTVTQVYAEISTFPERGRCVDRRVYKKSPTGTAGDL